ncbi:20S-pre-rRNA D-site endonuclease nob1 [Fulvia fulva]|uniref:20S-pre-rRNA D-site endonuclease NOB1 n=1 Tax=Passalora fulva TaxID=5499 RepID=A0A9Q8UR82_PASFU|nr:20S-pre-rRNA D-site endonuclease nob1 [Fulvia fulva]KAK4622253.1 20S-pre-rRNA D-site endonuclease nob1 [Fulvia fulva]KAK4622390.1 20S-pre-rRNA D-site endonuclease nob1 [Fulvia fulva]UJO19450.1 20S-pre-rRNA D-site endonuclease nob1 [Fulvia fulva]WPV16445.1 20S-pre-rRNA D-site endonuclease nob1 [Fulvia fulva]WPV31029.1 20S-pre-rRNA D-site endonuclease nob1 [Fulvia fulva]
MASIQSDKPVNTVVLDTGAIIKNEPPVSTLLNQAETLVTVPAIISEIKDAATRSRVETTLKPFLTIRSPNPTSIKFVTDFARKTGDLAVLSKPDIQIIALTYEIECERNGGDWRLRRVPGQKGVNGAPPARVEAKAAEGSVVNEGATPETNAELAEIPADGGNVVTKQETDLEGQAEPIAEGEEQTSPDDDVAQLTSDLEATGLDAEQDIPEDATETKVDSAQNSAEAQEESDSDSDGWITPSNLKKKQAADAGASTSQTPEPKTMQVAVLTSDFAMQNVILQMNLNLLSPSMTRIKQLRTYVLRCHACFCVHKDLSKQFCSRCGQPSLTRVSCSTSANGEFKLHLKKNMQWNTRGDRYSIPKPVHGSTNARRFHGGGKGGWGTELILAEDQKEAVRAGAVERRQKERSLMDEDYLPSILTGDRNRAGGRMKVGAGRNVNSKKR